MALSDGRRGIVAADTGSDPSKPLVRVTHEPGADAVTPYEMDLAEEPGVVVARQIGDPGGDPAVSGAERLAGMA